MADLNSLENLSGPVGAPAPLGQTPPTSFNPGIVNAGFAPVAEALTKGGGNVNPAIGSGTNQTVTGGSGMGAVSGGVAPGLAGLTGTTNPSHNVSGFLKAPEAEPMFIPEAEIEGQDLQNEEFSEAYETSGKRGLRQARRADRKADRAAREGLSGKAKRQQRREDRRGRKDSKWHAKSGA